MVQLVSLNPSGSRFHKQLRIDIPKRSGRTSTCRLNPAIGKARWVQVNPFSDVNSDMPLVLAVLPNRRSPDTRLGRGMRMAPEAYPSTQVHGSG